VQSTTAEERIARIAARQHGAVTRVQLLRAGISAKEIEYRLRIGALIRVYPGVYRVGHAAPSVEAWYMAAVLACGEGAVLCGRAAAHIQCLIKGPAPRPEVIAPTKRRVKGIKTRRSRIHPGERTRVRNIPVTTVARTLVDLAAELTLEELAKACHEAGVRYKTTPRQVNAVLARRPNAPGAAKLRAVMEGKAPVTLSKLEGRFLELVEQAALPLPITNRPAGGHRVDCRWPQHPLTVELDSYRYHNSRHSWEQDRKREREAYARGDQFRRYTYHDVFEDPSRMLAELRKLLA
jgi:predicted transcriptional regulator of viral defense system